MQPYAPRPPAAVVGPCPHAWREVLPHDQEQPQQDQPASEESKSEEEKTDDNESEENKSDDNKNGDSNNNSSLLVLFSGKSNYIWALLIQNENKIIY